jgi:hypothetical protein
MMNHALDNNRRKTYPKSNLRRGDPPACVGESSDGLIDELVFTELAFLTVSGWRLENSFSNGYPVIRLHFEEPRGTVLRFGMGVDFEDGINTIDVSANKHSAFVC